MTTDITDMSQASFQHTLLQALAENVPHRIYAKDIEGRFIFANAAVARGMGVSDQAELLGKTDFDFYPLEEAREYARLEQEVLVHGRPLLNQEEHVRYLLLREDVWLVTTKVPVRGEAGQIVGLVGINYDVTAQKAAEQALREAQTQLLQSEKMASIGQLAAGVAHEINNPIGYVNSNLGSLKRYVGDLLRLIADYERAESDLPPEARRRLQSVKAEVELEYMLKDLPVLLRESADGLERVKGIVQSLKDFSRVDSSDWVDADLNAGLDSTLNVVMNEVKYKAEVVKCYAPLPPVRCLAAQMNQVFMNLIVNAAHAIATHGTITLATGHDGEWVWVEVADTGCGMTSEVQRRILEPFFTTKPVGEGTGLGLSLSFSVVQKHKGVIQVNSEPGKGSVFRVWIPVNAEGLEEAPALPTGVDNKGRSPAMPRHVS
jgi:PAS domain S-box-containing protein